MFKKLLGRTAPATTGQPGAAVDPGAPSAPLSPSTATRVADATAQLLADRLDLEQLPSVVIEIELDELSRVVRLDHSPEDMVVDADVIEDLNGALAPLRDAGEDDQISSLAVAIIDGATYSTDIAYRY